MAAHQARALAQPPVARRQPFARQFAPKAMLQSLLGDDYQLVPLGSSLKFCLIARGAADVYLRLGPTSEWDTAAAQCVLQEAGGAVLDLHGNRSATTAANRCSIPNSSPSAMQAIDWAARLREAASE
jgi:3'(2'), 5'-bisphosphate nucleotidase